MESLTYQYPVFEANQVLMSKHLNDVFAYLDQQERQTRSHLIGIGIVCGLEIQRSGNTIALSKGCGVTSEGYLIVEPDDLTLVAFREYKLPPDIDYPPFSKTPFTMWELFEDGEPNTTPLGSQANFLDDKAVLLFLELKKDSLRNCSPNNCDDKGSQVTVTVRRLLIANSDLDKLIATANGLGSGLTASDIEAALSARLSLPDLRTRRFDVPHTNPVTSNDVYTCFLDMLRVGGLATATGNALTAAYNAFNPLLSASYQTNPFANFIATYGFLDSAPAKTEQVTFLPYYADFFDDLLRAYDEFRWAGLELICACCPRDDLFPRHLMLGVLNPQAVADPAIYRQGFLPSPAIGACARQTSDLLQLFNRLVTMASSFSDKPTLPQPNPSLAVDPQIRVTPSKQCCGSGELGAGAIPFYYSQGSQPPLFQLWSLEKTRRHRANQNLSYNADQYVPAAPAFVTDPLRYDIAPYDFLRIEGHLGKDYQEVLRSLLTLRSQYRLPIDVIALRTGVYDDSVPIDLSKESARFQDLEALYESLRGDLMAELSEGVMQLYDHPMQTLPGLTLNGGTPKLSLLQQYAPQFNYSANTAGAWYENYLARFETQPFINVDPNAINNNTIIYLYCTLFAGTQEPQPPDRAYIVAVYYLSKLAEDLPTTLGALNYADFASRYLDLMALIRYFRSGATASLPPEMGGFVPPPDFIDLCEEILMGCKLDAMKAINDDYVARIGDLKKQQFLSSFLQKEPGIQHKAGVPIGGTFIVVYHGDPGKGSLNGNFNFNFGLLQKQLGQVADVPLKTARMMPSRVATGSIDKSAVVKALGNISADSSLTKNSDLNTVIGWLAGQVANTGVTQVIQTGPAATVIGNAVGTLAVGTVIADFFLPYRVSGDGAGMQYVLPPIPPTFVVTVECTGGDGNASVTIDAKGGVPPYDVALDGKPYQALTGALSAPVGDHSVKLRDADGTETQAQPFTVTQQLVIGTPTYTCASGQYTGAASITGGTPPYQATGATVSGATITTSPSPSGTPVSVTVTDSKGCVASEQFNHTCPPPCTLPCAGIALNRNFRFFMPDGDANNPYASFKVNKASFVVESVQGKTVDLSQQLTSILVATADQLTANFSQTVNNWMTAINKLIASTPDLVQAGKAQWLTFGYTAVAPGRLGLMSIEYFQCLKFSLQLNVTYAMRSDPRTFTIAYAPSGTSIQVGSTAAVAIPAFDGTTTDKCSATPKPANLCPVPPAFTVQIQGASTSSPGQLVAFGASTLPPVSGVSFVWEAQDGTPALGNGEKFSTQFANAGTKVVTVTAFDSNGCSATKMTVVQVQAPPG